ncbi:helix-turn-helix domain-containing protein [Candidatus Micrarchaeota archaeon]|nr:helix-turn-helix domain-containing protein [Candidatus Micrarchaeota archaeon]
MVISYELKISVRHIGCYSDGFNSRFPSVAVECFNMQFIKGEAIDLFHIRLKSVSDAQNILDYLNSHPSIKKVHILEQSDSDLYLNIISRQVGNVKTLSEVIFKNGCYYLKPLIYKDDCEVWTLGSTSKQNFERVLEAIKKLGDVKIHFVRQNTFRDFLTSSERTALITARLMGYYSWPRKTHLRQIAKALGLSKTALLSSLRRAESKIIERFF